VTKYKLLWQALSNIEKGSILIDLPNNEQKKYQAPKNGYNCDIKINNIDALSQIIRSGDVGLGESYINNQWQTSDLANLLCFLTDNSNILEKYFHANKFQSIILFLTTFLNKNSKNGSKKNISFHYDLGNEFYELWLDESMTYSSALFNNKNISLKEGQYNKYNNILEKLSNKDILEIGCGWGGFAIEAAKKNFSIKCLTLSKKQQQYAKNKISSLAYNNQINIVLQDYRDEQGIYDNIVSIEMFEAVGQEYWSDYFNTLKRCLKKQGRAVLQIITIDDKVFKQYINRTDFIQKYIFPGGVLPSKEIIRNLCKDNNLKIISEHSFGHDYVKTLKLWLDNFDSKEEEIIELGFSHNFIKKWRFYLCYCIAGFSSTRTDVVQFELVNS
jgi:cyclopropane-fatty-acyl-phospholipid synthase